MKLGQLVIACSVMALTTSVAGAQEEAAAKKKGGKEQDPQAMMAAYEKAAEPAPEHKHLAKMVGKWTLSMKSWMDPKAPPMESTGTAETKAMLGDRFFQTTVTSNFMGKTFNGLGISGYDKAKKKFVGTWMDSMGTGMMRSEGTADAAGNVMTTQMVGTDPLTGKETKMKLVGKWDGADKMVEEFFEKKGGKEVKTMEITYTRAK
jgi:hypothetical protein